MRDDGCDGILGPFQCAPRTEIVEEQDLSIYHLLIGLPLFRSRVCDWILPHPGRPIPAFRHPDPPGAPAKMPLVCLDRGPHLRAHALVGPQQRHVPMRSAGGQNLDRA